MWLCSCAGCAGCVSSIIREAPEPAEPAEPAKLAKLVFQNGFQLLFGYRRYFVIFKFSDDQPASLSCRLLVAEWYLAFKSRNERLVDIQFVSYQYIITPSLSAFINIYFIRMPS